MNIKELRKIIKEEIKEAKDKYSVYDKKTWNIIRTNLTKDAAVKYLMGAGRNKGYAYGSAAWVEDNYREHNKNKNESLNEGGNDGYVELIIMDPNFEKGMKLINKAWSDWVNGPETTHTMINPAKKDLAEYVSKIISNKW